MVVKGKIRELREDGSAVIIAPVDIGQVTRRKCRDVYVDYIDARPISDKQRRMCYALLRAISDWSGGSAEDVKTAFKLEFWASEIETLGDKIFSLADAPMSLIAEFQRFLVGFIIDNDIPVKRPLREYADDIAHYTYMCVIHRKCAVCGRKAELVCLNGKGGATKLGHEVIGLCREHTSEIGSLGKKSFMEKYHLINGIGCDKTILKIYGLKG